MFGMGSRLPWSPELTIFFLPMHNEKWLRSKTFLDNYGLREKEYFLFVGRFVKENGVQHLIDSYLRLSTEHPLVLIGDDTVGNLYRDHIFKNYSDHPKILLLGYKFADEYEALLANALMYISASELEGTSPSLLAAMGAKVCTLVNGIEENLAALGGSGTVFKKNDYSDLILKWQQFIDQPFQIDHMAQKGYEYVLAHYSWEQISKEYISLFSTK